MGAESAWVVGFRRQNVWGGTGRKSLIVLAFYLGGLGAGTYICSVLMDFWLGALVGVLIVGIGKSASHIMFLGKPTRFLRAFRRPGSSWISRGIIFFSVFVLTGFLLTLAHFQPFANLPWASGSAFGTVLLWVSIIFAFLTMIYSGFLMNPTAIPLWNNPLVPVLFVVASQVSGNSLSLFLVRATGTVSSAMPLVEKTTVWGSGLFLLLLLTYLWTVASGNRAGARSVALLTNDPKLRWYFYGGLLGLGFALPLIVHFLAAGVPLAIGWLLLADLLEPLVGALLFRYLLFSGGVFMPLR